MAKKVSKTDAQLNRQKRLIDHYKQQTHWMKAVIIAAGVIILLLILLFGYATDWTRGLRKDDNLAAESAVGQLDTSASTLNGQGGGGSVTTRTNGTATDQNRSNTSTDSRSTTSTTTNNNTTTTPGSSGALIDLYSDTSIGENISGLLSQAQNLGIQINCEDNLLIQTCIFTENGLQITVKNLLGTGIITSITTNL